MLSGVRPPSDQLRTILFEKMDLFWGSDATQALNDLMAQSV